MSFAQVNSVALPEAVRCDGIRFQARGRDNEISSSGDRLPCRPGARFRVVAGDAWSSSGLSNAWSGRVFASNVIDRLTVFEEPCAAVGTRGWSRSMADRQGDTRGGSAERIYRETVAHLERTATRAIERIPDLVPGTRGELEIFRVADPSLDAVFVLKLIQLSGNIKSGEVLVEHGFYSEWDMVKRLIYESLEDIQFLALGERHRWTTQHDRYLDVFFSEDFDEHGSVVQRGVSPVQRREVAEFFKCVAGAEDERDVVVRSIARLHSASVHGRCTGIIRGCYEGQKRRFWTGGPRGETSMALERFALQLTTFHVVDVVARHVSPRWWGQGYVREASSLALRLRTAILPDG